MSMTDFGGRLLTGERILWSGRPAQGLWITGQDAFLIPFSLLWGGFAVFWETMVITQKNAPIFFSLWGVPFVLLGLYFIVGRFLFDAWLRRGILYAVTNQRILILRPGPFSKFTALGLDRLPEANLSEGASGRGTIRFGEPVSYWSRRRNNFSIWTPALDATPQFIGIEDAQGVFNQIQAAARSVGDRREPRRSESA